MFRLDINNLHKQGLCKGVKEKFWRGVVIGVGALQKLEVKNL